jgi:hypothetical protein
MHIHHEHLEELEQTLTTAPIASACRHYRGVINRLKFADRWIRAEINQPANPCIVGYVVAMSMASCADLNYTQPKILIRSNPFAGLQHGL